jgi:Fur family peroxide stress response transcriptional regulator
LTSSAEIQQRLDEMKLALEQREVTLTPRRAKVLEILATSDLHPSVSEIHAQVQLRFPSTSLATVYNTIELLKKAGQVLEIEFSAAANRYDGRRPEAHPHLVCVECHRIDDLDIPEPTDAFATVEATTGYEIVRQRTDYYGICPGCQRRRAGD